MARGPAPCRDGRAASYAYPATTDGERRLLGKIEGETERIVARAAGRPRQLRGIGRKRHGRCQHIVVLRARGQHAPPRVGNSDVRTHELGRRHRFSRPAPIADLGKHSLLLLAREQMEVVAGVSLHHAVEVRLGVFAENGRHGFHLCAQGGDDRIADFSDRHDVLLISLRPPKFDGG